MKIHIRDYQNTDQSAALALFCANCPAYFSPEEEKDFKHYLEHELEGYFVVEYGGEAVGCGGVNFSKDGKTGGLSWAMIHPDYHGRGIGRRLVSHRLDFLKKHPEVERIRVRTSQFTYGFYEKCGFRLEKVEKDYWAKGYDLYDMDYLL